MAWSNVPRYHLRNRKFYIAPCKDCADRVVGCHGNCEKYKTFKNESFEDYKKRKDTYLKELDAECHEVLSKVQTLKRKGKR